MRDKFKKILKYAISLSVAAVLLYFSFRGVEWNDFVNGLRDCRWGLILVSMAAGVAAFWLRGLRWRRLLLPLDPKMSVLTAFNAVNIGYIANFVFPRIGEFVRCGVISRRSSSEAAAASAEISAASAEAAPSLSRPVATYDKVLGTVVTERLWDMLSMLVFLAALLVFRWDKFGSFFVEKMWIPLSQRLEGDIWVMLAACLILLGAALWLVFRFRERNKICSKLFSVFNGIVQGLGSCLKMNHKWQFFFYTLLIWAMYWTMSIATMYAIPSFDNLNAVDALFLMLAGSLGWLIPVPGGFGSFHFIVSAALATIYGVPFETGIIFATLSHESQAITMAVCGCGSYVYETVKK